MKKAGAANASSGFPPTRKERDSNPWNAKRSTVFETAPIDHSGISPWMVSVGVLSPCGDRGIRTPEAFRLNGFQDRRYRPLSHISAAKIQLFGFMQLIRRKKIFTFAFLMPSKCVSYEVFGSYYFGYGADSHPPQLLLA